MPNISYNDSSLTYIGRWTDYGTSMGSNWQGSQIRFKVSGSLNLNVNVDVKDIDGTISQTGVVLNIDGANFAQVITTTVADIYTGAKTANFTLPDTDEHTIIMKVYAWPEQQWDETGYCRLNSFDINAGGSVNTWDKFGGYRVGFVGDSWMAVFHDWPFLMTQEKYWPYFISYGGAKAAPLNSKIDYDNPTTLNTDDPVLDIIIVNSSINDYNAGVTLSAFNTSFASLVDKLRAQQPTAKIILLQSPRNTTHSKNYDQYGPEMDSIALTRSNVEYVACPSSLWSSLTWLADTAHLDYASRQIFADFVEGEVNALVSNKRIFACILY